MQSTTLLYVASTIGLASAYGYGYGPNNYDPSYNAYNKGYGSSYEHGNPALLSGPRHYGKYNPIHEHGYGYDKLAFFGGPEHFIYGKPAEYGYGVGPGEYSSRRPFREGGFGQNEQKNSSNND